MCSNCYTYVLVANPPSAAQLADCVQGAATNVSNDTSLVVLKYTGSQPASLAGETEYTCAQIRTLLTTDADWIKTVEEA
jgi:hypothetical protein